MFQDDLTSSSSSSVPSPAAADNDSEFKANTTQIKKEESRSRSASPERLQIPTSDPAQSSEQQPQQQLQKEALPVTNPAAANVVNDKDVLSKFDAGNISSSSSLSQSASLVTTTTSSTTDLPISSSSITPSSVIDSQSAPPPSTITSLDRPVTLDKPVAFDRPFDRPLPAFDRPPQFDKLPFDRPFDRPSPFEKPPPGYDRPPGQFVDKPPYDKPQFDRPLTFDRSPYERPPSYDKSQSLDRPATSSASLGATSSYGKSSPQLERPLPPSLAFDHHRLPLDGAVPPPGFERPVLIKQEFMDRPPLAYPPPPSDYDRLHGLEARVRDPRDPHHMTELHPHHPPPPPHLFEPHRLDQHSREHDRESELQRKPSSSTDKDTESLLQPTLLKEVKKEVGADSCGETSMSSGATARDAEMHSAAAMDRLVCKESDLPDHDRMSPVSDFDPDERWGPEPEATVINEELTKTQHAM